MCTNEGVIVKSLHEANCFKWRRIVLNSTTKSRKFCIILENLWVAAEYWKANNLKKTNRYKNWETSVKIASQLPLSLSTHNRKSEEFRRYPLPTYAFPLCSGWLSLSYHLPAGVVNLQRGAVWWWHFSANVHIWDGDWRFTVGWQFARNQSAAKAVEPIWKHPSCSSNCLLPHQRTFEQTAAYPTQVFSLLWSKSLSKLGEGRPLLEGSAAPAAIALKSSIQRYWEYKFDRSKLQKHWKYFQIVRKIGRLCVCRCVLEYPAHQSRWPIG